MGPQIQTRKTIMQIELQGASRDQPDGFPRHYGEGVFVSTWPGTPSWPRGGAHDAGNILHPRFVPIEAAIGLCSRYRGHQAKPSDNNHQSWEKTLSRPSL